MAPVRSVRAIGTAGVGAHWRRDNRPDFPGIAVWVDALAEIEIETGAFGDSDEEDEFSAGERTDGESRSSGHGGEWAGGSQDSDDAGLVPSSVDAWSPEYAKVWRPLSGAGREPRPGLLVSVVRAGAVVAYPTPLPDPPTGALARALARLERPAVEPRPRILPIEAASAPAPPRRPTPPQKTYGEVRALVGVLVEILRGHRAATHAAHWTDPEVRGKLRTPRYARTASLKSVRLAESGDGVEALALLQEGGRTHVVALRFDRAEDSRWRCTALQTG